jgi:hypothetical protein
MRTKMEEDERKAADVEREQLKSEREWQKAMLMMQLEATRAHHANCNDNPR